MYMGRKMATFIHRFVPYGTKYSRHSFPFYPHFVPNGTIKTVSQLLSVVVFTIYKNILIKMRAHGIINQNAVFLYDLAAK
jgi:hypothetical protein